MFRKPFCSGPGWSSVIIVDSKSIIQRHTSYHISKLIRQQNCKARRPGHVENTITQNGMSQLNYKLIRHRLATCKMFHAFHPCLASTKRWLMVPPSYMLIVYKMNLWFCKNMIKIYSLQNACYLQNALPNITLTVQNSTLQSFCRQLKFSHSVGEIVRGMLIPIPCIRHHEFREFLESPTRPCPS